MQRDFQANLPPLGVEELWDAFVHGWSQPLALLGCTLLAAVSFAAAIAVAGGHGLAPNGIGLGG